MQKNFPQTIDGAALPQGSSHGISVQFFHVSEFLF
jgi:hypothetical protein